MSIKFKYKDIVEFEPESASWKKARVNQKENTLQSTLSWWPKNMQRFEILEFVEWWGFNADLQLVEPFHVQRRKKIHMNSCPSQFWQASKNHQRKIQFPTLASFWQAHTQVPNQLRKHVVQIAVDENMQKNVIKDPIHRLCTNSSIFPVHYWSIFQSLWWYCEITSCLEFEVRWNL